LTRFPVIISACAVLLLLYFWAFISVGDSWSRHPLSCSPELEHPIADSIYAVWAGTMYFGGGRYASGYGNTSRVELTLELWNCTKYPIQIEWSTNAFVLTSSYNTELSTTPPATAEPHLAVLPDSVCIGRVRSYNIPTEEEDLLELLEKSTLTYKVDETMTLRVKDLFSKSGSSDIDGILIPRAFNVDRTKHHVVPYRSVGSPR
jgi:hypothetical protein